jgi:hypothetical protein
MFVRTTSTLAELSDPSATFPERDSKGLQAVAIGCEIVDVNPHVAAARHPPGPSRRHDPTPEERNLRHGVTLFSTGC